MEEETRKKGFFMKRVTAKQGFMVAGAAIGALVALELTTGVPGPVSAVGAMTESKLEDSFPDCVSKTTGKVQVRGHTYSVSCSP